MDEVAALLEPVLDFRLKPDLLWPDGSAITAADVRATLAYVLPRSWPLPGRDAFRQIQSITEPEPGRVRVIYRQAYSPAFSAFITSILTGATGVFCARSNRPTPPKPPVCS